MEIKDLKTYHKNPRKITEKMFNLLGDSIKEFGDLSGIVVNVRTGEVIGGNQRTQFFKTDFQNVASITKTRMVDSPTNTVAYGYVEYRGEKYNYREVDWDEKKTERANIIANKVGGFWDNDILANEFDIEDLKFAGFEDFEFGMDHEDIELEGKSSSISEENKITISFTESEIADMIPKVELLMQENKLKSYKELFFHLLNNS